MNFFPCDHPHLKLSQRYHRTTKYLPNNLPIYIHQLQQTKFHHPLDCSFHHHCNNKLLYQFTTTPLQTHFQQHYSFHSTYSFVISIINTSDIHPSQPYHEQTSHCPTQFHNTCCTVNPALLPELPSLTNSNPQVQLLHDLLPAVTSSNIIAFNFTNTNHKLLNRNCNPVINNTEHFHPLPSDKQTSFHPHNHHCLQTYCLTATDFLFQTIVNVTKS